MPLPMFSPSWELDFPLNINTLNKYSKHTAASYRAAAEPAERYYYDIAIPVFNIVYVFLELLFKT